MALLCSLSGAVPEHAVVSPRSGAVFEKRLLEKHLAEHGTDPVSNDELSIDDVIEVKVPPTVSPRPPTATSIPALLKLFQDEWDSVMLETFRMRQNVETARQELSHALYQHDAACRVIARLTRERDQARQALSTLQPAAAAMAVTAADGPSGMEDVEGPGGPALPADVLAAIAKTHKSLSKERKARFKKLDRSELATPEDVKAYTEKNAFTGLHAASKSGMLSFDVHASNDNLVLTGGADKKAILFDRAQEKVVATLKGHTNKVTAVALHPSAEVAVSGSQDKSVMVWNLSTSKATGKITAHSGPVTGVSLHPTGGHVVSASSDKQWVFSDINTHQTLAAVTDDQAYTTVQVHPDGHIVGVGTESSLVQVWDAQELKKLATFEGHGGKIKAIAFSENGYHFATAGEDAMVKLWDLRNLKNLKTIQLEQNYTVSSVNFDNSGSFLVVGGSDVRVYGVKSAKKSAQVEAPSKEEPVVTFQTNTATVTGCKFGNNARSVISVGLDSKLRVYA